MALVRHMNRFISISRIQPKVNPSLLKSANQINFIRVASTTQPLQEKKEEVKVTFIRANGEKIETKGKIGDTLLDIVVNNEIDFDGFGACEGTLTCSTCHLILPKDVYDKLPDKPTDEENDMLDLASGLTETSRLGCQIVLTRDLDGLEVQVPPTLYDARS